MKGKVNEYMEINELIKRIKIELEDINEHKADYCNIPVEDTEAIIEYLEQLYQMTE